MVRYAPSVADYRATSPAGGGGMAAFLNEDHAKWQKVIRDAGIKFE
jgi:hypothetical protein